MRFTLLLWYDTRVFFLRLLLFLFLDRKYLFLVALWCMNQMMMIFIVFAFCFWNCSLASYNTLERNRSAGDFMRRNLKFLLRNDQRREEKKLKDKKKEMEWRRDTNLNRKVCWSSPLLRRNCVCECFFVVISLCLYRNYDKALRLILVKRCIDNKTGQQEDAEEDDEERIQFAIFNGSSNWFFSWLTWENVAVVLLVYIHT